MFRKLAIMCYYLLGDRCGRRGDYSRAMFYLSKVIKLQPRNPAAYNDRGVAFQGMRTFASSIADFDQAINLNPRLAIVYFNRGISQKFLGDYDRVIADQTRAISLDPKLADAHGELGFAYQCKDDFELSIAHLTTAINLAPKEFSHLKLRGCTQFCQGNFEAAAADLRRSLALGDDPYAMLLYYLARARLSEQANSELETIAKRLRNGLWPAPIFALYLGTMTADAALGAATNSDERAEAQFYLGEWHLLRNNREEAIKALKAAAQLCPPWFTEHAGAVAELKRLE
jgi:tetratricopeptide (TPR) repeat protein